MTEPIRPVFKQTESGEEKVEWAEIKNRDRFRVEPADSDDNYVNPKEILVACGDAYRHNKVWAVNTVPEKDFSEGHITVEGAARA